MNTGISFVEILPGIWQCWSSHRHWIRDLCAFLLDQCVLHHHPRLGALLLFGLLTCWWATLFHTSSKHGASESNLISLFFVENQELLHSSNMNFCTDVPWRTCDNSWNTRYCITPDERLNVSCWHQVDYWPNDFICATSLGNLSHGLLKDPVKEFWE